MGEKNQLYMISYSDELQFSTIVLQRTRIETKNRNNVQF